MCSRRTGCFDARLALSLLIAAALCACGRDERARDDGVATTRVGTSAGAPRSASPRAAALPVLRVGTSGDYAPFSKGGAGFDVEVAKRMAADLGYRIEWVPFTWPELQERVAASAFDVAMGGITWRADRSVVGLMSRAVATGGPCVLGRDAPDKVAVNRGGVLERWARDEFAAAQIRTVDDNLGLPLLLERGEVDAIVTDSFELAHFARPQWRSRCEPPRDRKVYWISPARVAALAPRIDGWLSTHEPQLRLLRAQWLGAASDWTQVDHLIDLLARRLALMPSVAAYKKARGLPIEDPAREAIVLQQAIDSAAAAGLEPESVRALFAEQIALAKAVQERAGDAEPLDLDTVLRPALSNLGERILSALAACASELPRLRPEQLDLLVPLIDAEERRRLLEALQAVRPKRR
jgi:cyclohexadienyl dehydratase